MTASLPGVCTRCRQPVIWNGLFWKEPGRGIGRRHACAVTAETINHLFADMAANDPEFRELREDGYRVPIS